MSKNRLASSLLGLLLVTLAPAALAVPYIANLDTTGGPTFNRPLTGTPPTGLSGVGTAVRYDTFEFHVDTAGVYSFVLSSTFDNFGVFYSPSFDPNAPLTNALIAADDTFGTNAGFSPNLAAMTNYVFVATSFGNADSGVLTLTINGPGTVIPANTAVPEPATLALLGLGLVGIAGLRRRV